MGEYNYGPDEHEMAGGFDGEPPEYVWMHNSLGYWFSVADECKENGDIKYVRADLTTPPTTDVVLVDREQAAKVADACADKWITDARWAARADDLVGGLAQSTYTMYAEIATGIAKTIRALPPYTKEHVDDH